MQRTVITKNNAGQRLDKFLHKYLPNAQNSFLYKMIRKKNITLNGKKAEGKEILREGDVVESFFSEETFGKMTLKTGQDPYQKAYRIFGQLQILYEDSEILAVNKPVGMLTQKAKDDDVSLNEWLIGYLLGTGQLTEQELNLFHPSVCNRLDKNTSGIVLCGKTLGGLQFLSELIRTRKIRKFYRTICLGEIKEPLSLEGYLQKDSVKNRATVSHSGTEPGDYIKTNAVPLKTDGAYTYLEVQLFTGKPHQIRAHLSSIGHPVIGDAKYGDAKSHKTALSKYKLSHQLLHACRVEFPEKIPEKYQNDFSQLSNAVIEAELPAKFEEVLSSLGFSSRCTHFWTERFMDSEEGRQLLEQMNAHAFLDRICKKYHYPEEERNQIAHVSAQIKDRIYEEAAFSFRVMEASDLLIFKKGSSDVLPNEAVCTVITLGGGMDDLQEEYSQKQMLSECYMAEVISGELLLESYAVCNKRIHARLGQNVLRYYFFGSSHREELEKMPEILEKSGLMVSCNNAYCMIPKKSVAFLSYLTKDETAVCPGICVNCGSLDCPNRMGEQDRRYGREADFAQAAFTYGYARIFGRKYT